MEYGGTSAGRIKQRESEERKNGHIAPWSGMFVWTSGGASR